MDMISIPQFDREALIHDLDAHAIDMGDAAFSPHTLGLYKPSVGEALLHELLPEVQRITGKDLWVCNSFGRIALHGAELKEHCDRPGLDWTISINVRRDSRWIIEGYRDGSWESVEDTAVLGVLWNGSIHPHRRPRYEGQKAYQLFLHYTEDPRREGDRQLPIAEPTPLPVESDSDPLPLSHIVVTQLLRPEEISRLYEQFDDAMLNPGMVTYRGIPSSNRANMISWLKRPQWQWLYGHILDVVKRVNDANWAVDIDGVSCDELQFTRYEP